MEVLLAIMLAKMEYNFGAFRRQQLIPVPAVTGLSSHPDEQQPAADVPSAPAKQVQQREGTRKRHSPSPEWALNSSDSEFTGSDFPAEQFDRCTHKKQRA